MAPRKGNQRHLDALAFYISLGAGRSLAQVARKFNVTVQTTNTWNKREGWQEKVAEIDKRAGQRAIAKAEETLVDAKARVITIARATQVKFAQNLQAGMIDPNCSDFVAVAKLELAVRGAGVGPSEPGDLHGDLSLADADAIILEETKRITAIRARSGQSPL